MEICCSCNSLIQAIRALTGDSRVDKLSQEKSCLLVSNGKCLNQQHPSVQPRLLKS